MEVNIIHSVEDYDSIVNDYKRKGCLSNNFLMLDEVKEIAAEGKLFCQCSMDNAFLFVQKEECKRIYYYLNNLDDIIPLKPDDNYVVEILYRGESKYPEAEVKYLEKCGMKVHLVRDQYEALYSAMQPALDFLIPDDVEIRYADSIEEVNFAADLFNGSFDHYSGDYIADGQMAGLLSNREILIAMVDGKRAGALHVERNRANWIGHLAVQKEYRGHHIASALVRRFVEWNYNDDKTRYAVWVQHQNEPAVKLYQKSGFKYMNKSTLSMLKLK